MRTVIFDVRVAKKLVTSPRTRNKSKSTTAKTTFEYSTPSRLVTVGEGDHYPLTNKTDILQNRKFKTNNPRSLKICTYNVRSLSNNMRMLELNNSIEKITWDIIGLAEIKRNGSAIEKHQNYIFYYIGETAGLHGVGFLVKKSYKANIVSFLGISERVAMLKLKFDQHLLSLIQAYSPTDSSSEEDITKFFEDLTKAQDLADKNFLIMGDFNAKIGQPKIYETITLGKHGYGERNERGERLIQYAYENKLAIMNTFYKKINSRKWAWISPDHKTKNEIDFILSPNPAYVMNVEIINNMTFPSDHRMVRCTLRIDSSKMSRRTFNTPLCKLKSTQEKTNYIQNLKENLLKSKETIESTENVQTLNTTLERNDYKKP